MKCLIDITDPENIIRVKDADAFELVHGTTGKLNGRIRGNYDYCPKSVWKPTRPAPKKQGKNKED